MEKKPQTLADLLKELSAYPQDLDVKLVNLTLVSRMGNAVEYRYPGMTVRRTRGEPKDSVGS